ISIYENVRRALCNALATSAVRAEMSSVAAVSDCRHGSAIGNRRHNECFGNPVRADVLSNGRKVAGAAQRQTRRGLLQQGSIQDVNLAADFQKTFASKLSDNWRERTISQCLLQRAKEIADQKYAALAWL